MINLIKSLVFIVFAINGTLHAQSLDSLFKGKKIKIKESGSIVFHAMFYPSLDVVRSADPLRGSNVLFPKYKTSAESDPAKFGGRVFLIDSVFYGVRNQYYDDNGTTFFGLIDTLTFQKIYFRYGHHDRKSLPFILQSFNREGNPVFQDPQILEAQIQHRLDSLNGLPKCTDLIRSVDDFTDEITFRLPLSGLDGIFLQKKFSKTGIVTYYLMATIISSNLDYGTKGLYFIFTDGSKLYKPNCMIEVDVNDGDFYYRAFQTITATELSLFTVKTIKKFRVYIYDEDVNPDVGARLKLYAKCLKSAK